MSSRRAFLKSLGLGAAALSAGYGAAGLIKLYNMNFSLNAFIPADDLIINDIIKTLRGKFNTESFLINAPEDLKNKLLGIPGVNTHYSGSGLTLTMKRINDTINSDILLSDAKKIIYDPQSDFDLSFISIRDRLKLRKADYFFSAEYIERNLLAELVSGSKKVLMIENERGIQDQVPLPSNKQIVLKGPSGKTLVNIKDGLVSVENTSCKNKLCKLHGSISREGSTIACVPNKFILRIERG